jgi:type I restriction enzyme S subunit
VNNGDYELPSGWVWAKVEDIAEVNPGLPQSNLPHDLEVSFIPMRVVGESTGQVDLTLTAKYEKVKKGYTAFMNGDIIFARITPCMENGKIAILENLKNGIGFGSTEFHVIRLRDQSISTKFLFYYLLREDFRREAKRSMTGTAGQLRVPARFIKEASIPLAPSPEQRRIVARVEALLAESKTAREALVKVPVLLRRFRQSVLAKAFRGELTQRDPNDEPAQKLLRKIKQERQFKEEYKYREPQPIDEELYPLPEGWIWARLGQISHVIKDHIDPNEKPEEEFNYLSIENIESESGELVNFSPTLGKDIHSTKLVFTNQDLLYSKLRPYLNKVHVPKFSGVSATDLIPLRPEGGIPREYIAYYLRTQRVVEYANQKVRGIQLPRLPVDDLLSLFIPIAPLKEMNRIVLKINDLFSLAKAIENMVKRAKDRADRIDQAILAKAFRGELVPQDPNDEPASVLLQRLKSKTKQQSTIQAKLTN